MKTLYRIVPENDQDYDGVPSYEIQYRFVWWPFWQKLDYRSYSMEAAKNKIDHLVKPPVYYQPE